MIVFPMAGKSNRFKQAGFVTEKYMLYLGELRIIQWVLKSFERYSNSDVLFILGEHNSNDAKYILRYAQAAFQGKVEVIVLGTPSLGQAHTVAMGVEESSLNMDQNLLIFNIDTIRPNFKSIYFDAKMNFIETFKGEGEHWSFVSPSKTQQSIAEAIIEKVRISDKCCTGAYGFASTNLFLELQKLSLDFLRSQKYRIENYVSQVIQIGIEQGKTFYFEEVDTNRVFLSGTPNEFWNLSADKLAEAFLKN